MWLLSDDKRAAPRPGRWAFETTTKMADCQRVNNTLKKPRTIYKYQL